MSENLIAVGMMLVVFPILAVLLSDTFEDGCVLMLFAQVIIGIVLIIAGACAMLGGE